MIEGVIEVIEESHFNSKIAIINIFFASFPSHLTTQKHYFVTISVTCHMDFGKIFPWYQAKPSSLLLLCESAMTPLWLRFFACRDYTYNKVQRDTGSKRQVHWFTFSGRCTCPRDSLSMKRSEFTFYFSDSGLHQFPDTCFLLCWTYIV